MTPQGPSTRRLRSLVMGVSLFHGMQKENTRRQQFDKVVDLPKGKLLSFQLKKISIIHEHFHLFHMYEYNNSSLILKNLLFKGIRTYCDIYLQFQEK